MKDSEILALIERIQRVEYLEEELGRMLEEMERATACPHISDLIFYGEDSDTPEDILRKAREYRPIQL